MARYIAELINPWYQAVQVSDTAEKENKAELISKIAAPQLPKYAPKIKKLYKKVACAGGEAEPGEGSSVDCAEFLMFAKNCKLCDANFTMSNALDVYMHCNMEEMQAYIEKVEPMSDINKVWWTLPHASAS